MSCWQYCQKCGLPLGKPTPFEVVNELRDCSHCGATMDPHMSVGDLVLDLIERIEKLEQQIQEKK